MKTAEDLYEKQMFQQSRSHGEDIKGEKKYTDARCNGWAEKFVSSSGENGQRSQLVKNGRGGGLEKAAFGKRE